MKELIRQKAFELGFDLAGFTSAEPIEAKYSESFRKWLEQGYNGEMAYLQRNLEKRLAPSRLLPSAQTVICLGKRYKPEASQFTSESSFESGRVSNYALYPDYHKFLKGKLFQLADYIKTITRDETEFKFCVDSVPLLERAFAVRAGLGFIGKNTMLINPKYGSQIFLAEILTNCHFEPDKPFPTSPDPCQGCERCIRACPGGALSGARSLDARRCVSYLTIEKRTPLTKNEAVIVGNSLFGCDRCIEACPYEQKAKASCDNSFKPEVVSRFIKIPEILVCTEQDFKTKFSGTSLERAGLEKLQETAGTIKDSARRGRE